MPRTIAAARVGTPSWTRREEAVFRKLSSPARIQDFVDELRYSTDPIYRSPRQVIRDRTAHCADGALFAAAALRRLGYPPQLVDLRAVRDDDHVLAVFRERGLWGAVSKSNTAGLRYREPIHRTLHELVLSYFEWYYNLEREKTLRAYSRPIDLRRFDRLAWMTDDTGLEQIMQVLDDAPHLPLLSRAAIARLRPVDERCFRGGLVGVRWAGLYGYTRG